MSLACSAASTSRAPLAVPRRAVKKLAAAAPPLHHTLKPLPARGGGESVGE